MCPFCPLSKAGINPAFWVAMGIIGLFMIAGIAAIIWAWKTGLFKNIEEAKYRMMESEKK